jgi:exodeoxyribonuclease VII large subunit
MRPLPLFRPTSLSVTEVNRYLRQLLESDPILQDLWVQGELSNFSRPTSGHIYFTLKDSLAALRVVMWRSTAQTLRIALRDGMAVEVHGKISMYETGGQLQLYADEIRPAGEGQLYQEFLRLKARLEAEGLFDQARKRPIPGMPHRIGIVTSPTAAALQDILNTLRRRYPLAEVVLSPTPVQGEEAVPGVIAALERLNRLAKPDVILLARGGGSLEDLWAFNDEGVARAIAASQAPVITGIGHEIDFTIADFAADLRAPTPTAAAELATPDRQDLLSALLEKTNQLQRYYQVLLTTQRWQLNNQTGSLQRYSPTSQVNNYRQQLDESLRRSERALIQTFELNQTRLRGLQTRLISLSPQSILNRGYAMVLRQDDKSLVRSTRQVQVNDDLSVQLSDGVVDVKVTLNHPGAINGTV